MSALVSISIKRESMTLFSECPLNTDTRIIRAVLHVPLVFVLPGFHCTVLGIFLFQKVAFIFTTFLISAFINSLLTITTVPSLNKLIKFVILEFRQKPNTGKLHKRDMQIKSRQCHKAHRAHSQIPH